MKFKTYQYDKAGNITYKSDIGYYRYNSLLPHAVVKAGSGIYRYDHMGNMIYRDGDIISYYPNAKVAKIVGEGGNELRYYYGDDNSRYLENKGQSPP